MKAFYFPWAFSLVVLLVGCSLTDDNHDDVLFITFSGTPAGHMQALYQGKVDVRGSCLRLADSDSGHTVVWPYGSYLDGPGDRIIYTNEGKVLGMIGGQFRFGGGEVPTLWENGPVAEQVRQRALGECPGKYWLVGDVYTD